MWRGYWLSTSKTIIENINGIINRRNEHGARGSEGTKKRVGPLDFLADWQTVLQNFLAAALYVMQGPSDTDEGP